MHGKIIFFFYSMKCCNSKIYVHKLDYNT